jgi:hypothetical protein
LRQTQEDGTNIKRLVTYTQSMENTCKRIIINTSSVLIWILDMNLFFIWMTPPKYHFWQLCKSNTREDNQSAKVHKMVVLAKKAKTRRWHYRQATYNCSVYFVAVHILLKWCRPIFCERYLRCIEPFKYIPKLFCTNEQPRVQLAHSMQCNHAN